MELIFAFAIKLRESISKELISRDFKYPSLQSIIEAAERYEVHGFSRVTHNQDLSPTWRPDALYSGHNMAARPRPNMNSNNMKYTNTANPNHNSPNGHGKPRLSNGPKSPIIPSFSHTGHSGSRPQDPFQASGQGQKSKEICVKFNKFRKAHCELANDVCYYNRLHKCQVCYHWGCKALTHHNSSNSRTIININSFNSARSTSVSGARPVRNYSHAHVASGDVDQCFGNDHQQISGITNGVNITTDTHCQNFDLTSVLSSMNNSLQFLSVCMEKMERSLIPKPLVPLLLPQAQIIATSRLWLSSYYSHS